MSYEHPELAGSKVHPTVLKPKDAATLILVRRQSGGPRILMGQRAGGHAFMPNKYVFPGGRLDAADCRVKPARDLHPATLAKLLHRMRGKPSETRARGLAQAAVRETWEEAGLLFGRATAEDAPDLSGLTLFMRAITPPGRTRRFDSRFFVADAEHLANIDEPAHDGGGELLTLSWLTLDDIASLDLPLITIDALTRLKPFLDQGSLPGPDCPASFQYYRGKTWVDDRIALDISAPPRLDFTRHFGSIRTKSRLETVMAKGNVIKIKLASTADTGYFYVTKKNSRTKTDKLSFKKYDPVARKHVEFKETKIK